jgi:antitoxin CcdA
MRGVKVNLTPDAEAAISDAARVETNRRWREDSRTALAAYSEDVTGAGVPLARFRNF